MSCMSDEDEQLSRPIALDGMYPPFVELLGITFEPLDDDICIKLKMRDELALSFRGGTLNGAAISAIMEIVGGTVVSWSLKDEVGGQPVREQAGRPNGVSTIDLRVDYLKPARGKVFTATGSILRSGSRVAVTHMELRNEDQSLIAVGTGTYGVG